MPSQQHKRHSTTSSSLKTESSDERVDFGSNSSNEEELEESSQEESTSILDTLGLNGITSTCFTDPTPDPNGTTELESPQWLSSPDPQITSKELYDPKAPKLGTFLPDNDGTQTTSIDLSDPEQLGKQPRVYSDKELFPDEPDQTQLDKEAYAKLDKQYFDKDNRQSSTNEDERVRNSDDVAHKMGIDGQRQGFFIPEARESYDSNRQNKIALKNRDKKTDEVYLKRTFEKDKTFEKDGRLEHQHLLGNTGKAKKNSLEKMRKLAVRSSKAIDGHSEKVTKMEAMSAGAARASKELRDQAIDSIEANLRTPGTESDEQREAALESKAKAEKYGKQYENWKTTHQELSQASKASAGKADTAYETSRWANEWEAKSKDDKHSGVDFTNIVKDGQAKIAVSLEDRKITKRYADAADSVQDEMVEDGLYDDGIMGKLNGAWRGVKGKVPTIVLGMLTGGMLERENRDLEGGRVQEFKWNFVPFKRLKESLQKFSKIRSQEVMGGQLASTIYGGLMVLSEGILPSIRDILGSIAIWVSLISIFTGGTGLAVGAAAGGLALFVSMLKLAVDLGLGLWAGIMSNKHKDHDHRKEELASSETYQRGMDVLLGGVTVGMNVNTGISSTGQKLGTGKLMKNTVKDVQGNNTKTGYGSTGLRQGEVGWQDKVGLGGKHDTIGQKGHQSTDLMVKSGGKLVLKGGNTVNDKLVKRGGVQHTKNLKQRDMVQTSNEQELQRSNEEEKRDQESREQHHRKLHGLSPEELFGETKQPESKEPELAQESMGKVDSRMDKLGGQFEKLTEKMQKAAKKANSKELEKAGVGDPKVGLDQLAEIGPELKATTKR